MGTGDHVNRVQGILFNALRDSFVRNAHMAINHLIRLYMVANVILPISRMTQMYVMCC